MYLMAVESRSLLGSFTLGSDVLSLCWPTPTLGVAGLKDGRLVVVDAVVSITLYCNVYDFYGSLLCHGFSGMYVINECEREV